MKTGNNTAEATLQLVKVLREIVEADTKLRLSQKKALNEFLEREDVPVRGIFNLATGVGKTRLMAMMALAQGQVNPDSKIVVAVPNNHLILQEQRYFGAYRNYQNKKRIASGFPPFGGNPTTGRYDQDGKDTDAQIIFTTYHSLKNLTDALETDQVGLVLLDEAHHVVSEKRSGALAKFNLALHYGYTATPWYSPEKSAEKVIGEILATVDIPDAIQENDLAGFKNVLMVADVAVDLSGIPKNSHGDYDEKAYHRAIAKALAGNSVASDDEDNWEEAHRQIAQKVAEYYHTYVDEDVGPLNGKKCLINCRSQEEARIQAEELNRLFGYEVARVHTSDHSDPETLKAFMHGELPVVCQVGKLTEGFDMPALAMTINYPTASYVREAQGAARCIRRFSDGTEKTGLIVDIAFKHPGVEDVVDAIHQNRQVLFQDVVGGPVILNPGVKVKGTPLETGGGVRGPEKVKIDGFTIISDIQELIRLSNEAKEAEVARFVPDIRSGMLTSVGLEKTYEIASVTAKGYLEDAYKKKIQFTAEDGEHDLVEWVKSSGRICLALNESQGARQKFQEMYPDITICAIRPQMLSSHGMGDVYGISPTIAARYLQEMYDHRETFTDDNGQTHALTEWVKNNGKKCLALCDAPQARQKFEALYPDVTISAVRPGMLTTEGLQKKYTTSHRKAKQYLEEAYNRKIQFTDANGQAYDLVEKVKSGPKICLALSEREEARREFEKLHPDLMISAPRPGMLTCLGLANEYEISQVTAVKYLEKAKQENLQFVDETGHVHAVVESVKSGPKICLAIHESLFARAVFMAFVQRESQGRVKALSPRLITGQAPYAPKKIEAQAPVQDQHQQE